jgi:hypothetical protein
MLLVAAPLLIVAPAPPYTGMLFLPHCCFRTPAMCIC